MASAEAKPDPVRSTLIAVLQQLNRAESMHEGHEHRQTLELREIERLLSDFWAIKLDQVKVPLVLGLLVRNGMVDVQAGAPGASPARGLAPAAYRITTEGKRFLVESSKQIDRIR